MPGLLVSLLVAVLVLVLVKYVLEAFDLPEPARKVLWIIAVVVAVWYVIDPSIIH